MGRGKIQSAKIFFEFFGHLGLFRKQKAAVLLKFFTSAEFTRASFTMFLYCALAVSEIVKLLKTTLAFLKFFGPGTEIYL